MTNQELIRYWRIELAQDIVSGKESHELDSEARLLEDYIEQHGVMERYAVELMFIVGITPAGDSMCAVGAFDAWRIIRATPRQRAQAFLQVMERCGV